MTVLGVAVAGTVIVARLAVADESTLKMRAIVTGFVALMTSSAMAFALCSLVQSGNPLSSRGRHRSPGGLRIRNGHLPPHLRSLRQDPFPQLLLVSIQQVSLPVEVIG